MARSVQLTQVLSMAQQNAKMSSLILVNESPLPWGAAAMIAALLIYKSVVTQRKHEGLCANRGYVLAKSKWVIPTVRLNSRLNFHVPIQAMHLARCLAHFKRRKSKVHFGGHPNGTVPSSLAVEAFQFQQFRITGHHPASLQ